MKTDIFNLIILDESGSMSWVTDQTISGCNETINTIRSAQEKFSDTQNHYVSIYAFQSDAKIPSRFLIKNQPVEKVRHIGNDDYRPNGSTPLYDAVGATLVDLKLVVDEKDIAIGAVTIITDGMENASKHYSREKIVKMIDSLKEVGWTFNFIGADIDVKPVADSLHMDSSLAFSKKGHGTSHMFHTQNSARMRYYEEADMAMAEERIDSKGHIRKEVLYKKYRAKADKYFEEDEKK